MGWWTLFICKKWGVDGFKIAALKQTIQNPQLLAIASFSYQMEHMLRELWQPNERYRRLR